jgi:hypothetical protein
MTTEPSQIDLATLLAELDDLLPETVTKVFHEVQDRPLKELPTEGLPDGGARLVKWGTRERPLITSKGRIVLVVQKIRDRLERKVFSPLHRALGIKGHKYTRELRLLVADTAGCTSYREPSRLVHKATGVWVPPRTGWSFVQEVAREVERELKGNPVMVQDPVHLADGTEVRSQEKGGHHDVQVAAVRDPETHQVQVVAVEVNTPAGDVLKGENVERLMTGDNPAYERVGVVAHGRCLRHLGKRVRWLLWNDQGVGNGSATREERKEFLRNLSELLWTLEHSVKKHRKDHDWDALVKRIQTTLRGLSALATRMEKAGYTAAAKYVRSNGRVAVVFAEMAILGHWMPATTKGIERIMGMIADRCKRKWAYWGSGLRNLVLLLLTRKTRLGVFVKAQARYLKGGQVMRCRSRPSSTSYNTAPNGYRPEGIRILQSILSMHPSTQER